VSLAALLALSLLLGAEHLSSAQTAKPSYLWLWYADGSAMPDSPQDCIDLGVPPPYQCNFGSSLKNCQVQVQTYLDAWYKDLNLVFTFTRPPSTSYYTVVITSGWPRCATEAAELTGGSASNEGGIARGYTCDGAPSEQTAIAIACGKNAHDCAAIIAHEHGHLVGLAHTTSTPDAMASTTDVMNPWIQSTAAGFENKALAVVQDSADVCQSPTQNSYQRMLSALGPWPGGTKPSPLPPLPDAGATDAALDAASDLAPVDAVDAPPPPGSVGYTTPEMDGGNGVAVLPGFDANVRPTIPTVNTSGNKPSAPSRGGCSMAPARPHASTSAVFLLIALALFACRAGLHRAPAGSRRSPARRPQPRHFLA
jgi:hypothetical protein